MVTAEAKKSEAESKKSEAKSVAEATKPDVLKDKDGKELMRFQVTAGSHTQDDPDGTVAPGSITKDNPKGMIKKIRYRKGDTFLSTVDWASRYPEKFRRIYSEHQKEVVERIVVKPMEAMTVGELREYAEANEIDLGTSTKKDEILNLIRAALPG